MPDESVGASFAGAGCVVLGASGFIGRWVARALTDAGASVTLVVRDAAAMARIAGAWRTPGRIVELDVTDRPSLARLFQAQRPDVVFNAAGYGVDRSERDGTAMQGLNRDLPRDLVDLLAAAPRSGWPGARLVHVGSALEYGPLPTVLFEDGPARPHTAYGRSKLDGTLSLHAAASATGLSSITARLFTVFGPGEHKGRLLPTLIAAAVSGSEARLSSGGQLRDFTFVEDVAEGLLRLAVVPGAPPGLVVNLGTGQLRSVREFAVTAAGVLGLPAERLAFGAQPVRDDEMRPAGVSIDRLVALTRWSPGASLDAALRRARAFRGMFVNGGGADWSGV